MPGIMLGVGVTLAVGGLALLPLESSLWRVLGGSLLISGVAVTVLATWAGGWIHRSAPLAARREKKLERLAREARYRESLICQQCGHRSSEDVKATSEGYLPADDAPRRCPSCEQSAEGFVSLGFELLNDAAKKRVKYGGPPDSAERQREQIDRELMRYAKAHGVELGTPEWIGRGFIYGTGADVVFYLPAAGEVGGGSRAFAEHYLRTGEKISGDK